MSAAEKYKGYAGVLICPPWPGRNPFADVRKVSCLECKTNVSVCTHNIQVLKNDNVAIICESCFARFQAESDFVCKSGGVNLPSSGRHFEEKDETPTDSEWRN